MAAAGIAGVITMSAQDGGGSVPPDRLELLPGPTIGPPAFPDASAFTILTASETTAIEDLIRSGADPLIAPALTGRAYDSENVVLWTSGSERIGAVVMIRFDTPQHLDRVVQRAPPAQAENATFLVPARGRIQTTARTVTVAGLREMWIYVDLRGTPSVVATKMAEYDALFVMSAN